MTSFLSELLKSETNDDHGNYPINVLKKIIQEIGGNKPF